MGCSVSRSYSAYRTILYSCIKREARLHVIRKASRCTGVRYDLGVWCIALLEGYRILALGWSFWICIQRRLESTASQQRRNEEERTRDFSEGWCVLFDHSLSYISLLIVCQQTGSLLNLTPHDLTPVATPLPLPDS